MAQQGESHRKKHLTSLSTCSLTALASQQQNPARGQRAKELGGYSLLSAASLGTEQAGGGAGYIQRQTENIQLNTLAYAFSKLDP